MIIQWLHFWVTKSRTKSFHDMSFDLKIGHPKIPFFKWFSFVDHKHHVQTHPNEYNVYIYMYMIMVCLVIWYITFLYIQMTEHTQSPKSMNIIHIYIFIIICIYIYCSWYIDISAWWISCDTSSHSAASTATNVEWPPCRGVEISQGFSSLYTSVTINGPIVVGNIVINHIYIPTTLIKLLYNVCTSYNIFSII